MQFKSKHNSLITNNLQLIVRSVDSKIDVGVIFIYFTRAIIMYFILIKKIHF